ncbi:MAG TPA: M15 family metallopeptidase [Candidatus Saccharimonadales bacterium]|nr:M15 family metallopeptidase [Candidatus Saccharimonadales bacterium]
MQPNRRRPYQPQTGPKPPLLQRLVRKELIITLLSLAIAVLLFTFFFAHHKDTKKTNSSKTAGNTSTPAANSFDKKQHSTTDPNSIWVVVNKPLPLSPIDYAPTDLTVPSVPLRVPGNESMQVRQVTAAAMEKMFAGATGAGYNLMLASGYRSYSYQVNLYNGYVKSSSVAEADKTSARPGHSEHQTGLAFDVEPTTKQCELDTCFGDLPEGKWLAANAYKYGFIIRYPADKVSVTGYDFEPWHVRYVGVPLATELHNSHAETLEEFFGVKGGKDFN